MENGFSIIICCYNSASKLPETLAHIARQENTEFPWELIIIDNASTDQTAAVAKSLLNLYTGTFSYRIINEHKAGQGHARNTGVAEAQYEYIVFCDDDNWLCETYLSTAYTLLTQHPNVGAVGGQGEAVSHGPLPTWFEADQIAYAVGPQGKQSGDVTARAYLYGAGLATRKSLFLAVYASFPSLLTGRTGQKLSSGDDTEYCLRLVLKGFQLYYSEELRFKHFLDEKRLTVEYRDKLFQSFRDTDEILHKYFHAIKLTAKIKGPATRFWWIMRAVLKLTFSFRNDKKQKAKNIFYLLSPYQSPNDPAINAIKKFIYKPLAPIPPTT